MANKSSPFASDAAQNVAVKSDLRENQRQEENLIKRDSREITLKEHIRRNMKIFIKSCDETYKCKILLHKSTV